jgi:hypothetical protein
MQFDLDELRKRWGEHGHQTCHQFHVAGQRKRDKNGQSTDVWCRGFWENAMPKDQREFIEQAGLVESVPQRCKIE